ncbi:hypothetical protein [Thiorhodovibrio frisius]|uniref:hypothetical protein n=1 Tax=Thiorhodovibrio frisius TaxID=631362 RepID=UPI000255E2E8|nr:hypothetical protein [Thiorhodovibrio frisius]
MDPLHFSSVLFGKGIATAALEPAIKHGLERRFQRTRQSPAIAELARAHPLPLGLADWLSRVCQ